MTRKSLYAILLPIVALIILFLGFFVGRRTALMDNQRGTDKLSQAMQLIRDQYVDAVDEDELMEQAVDALFRGLDPHSEYISKSEIESVNEDLDGSFSGIGISFQIVSDTVTVVESIVGGPAEKSGIMAGDRIVSADGQPLAGPNVKEEDVFKLLRGKKGTTVDVEVKRYNSPKTTHYTLKRDDIPVNSVDAYYLMDDGETGYIKLSKFTRNTYLEFQMAQSVLRAQGAKRLILDLRNNPGGYMDQAVAIANEFLPKGRRIVYTKGRSAENQLSAVSDGSGSLTSVPIAVLINEYSASASEIIAGAIQDNDRGLVIGRRSFGKGLVQNQISLPDGSAVRLTVARYYTPSGRSIQKDYKIGDIIDYDLDIMNRYDRGEFYHLDSIQLDKSKAFLTTGGRKVYGGGGIMPDYFVPEDTTQVTSYYINVNNAGLLQQYAYNVADRYRTLAKNAKDDAQLMRMLPSDDILLEGFAEYAEQRGVPARWYYIEISRDLILGQIKALVTRDLLGYNFFYKIFNLTDPTIRVAVDVLKKGGLPSAPISK